MHALKSGNEDIPSPPVWGLAGQLVFVYNCYITGRRESGRVFDNLSCRKTGGGAARGSRGFEV